jgi:hypothetical protein
MGIARTSAEEVRIEGACRPWNNNAENLLVLDDSASAAQYRTNWERRQAASTQYVEALPSGPAEGE